MNLQYSLKKACLEIANTNDVDAVFEATIQIKALIMEFNLDKVTVNRVLESVRLVNMMSVFVGRLDLTQPEQMKYDCLLKEYKEILSNYIKEIQTK